MTIETALDREIRKYVSRGYRVVSRTDTTAQLVQEKRFSCLWATLWTLALGIGLIFYLFWYASKKDQILYLELLPDGKVKATWGKG